MSSAKPNKKTSAALPAVSQSTASSTEEKVDGEVTEEWPGWAPVESEPVSISLSASDILFSNISNVDMQAIFTELIKEFGVKGVVVQDVYSTDEDTMRGFVNAHGIIFLFRHRDNEEVEGDIETTCPEGVWFANQVSASPPKRVAQTLGPSASPIKALKSPTTTTSLPLHFTLQILTANRSSKTPAHRLRCSISSPTQPPNSAQRSQRSRSSRLL